LQISIEELRLALTFLKEQLGEDEVVSLLKQLHVEGGASSGVEVAKLIQMALKQEDEENSKAEKE
jgi:Ca2+-binding EF-hand superfamily protein